MSGMKSQVLELLDRLPDNCLLEDVEREIYLHHAADRAEVTGEDCILRYKRRLGHHPEMLEGSAKDEVREVLDLLDNFCSLDDVYYTLCVRERIRQADWSLKNERTYTHEEVVQRLARWLKD
jgi:hypothetical protein